MYSRQFQLYSRQFQFVHGNFNLLTAISIYSRQFQLVQTISVCSRQFQFTHGNFNLFTAISICSRQFQFTHGNFNFLTANNAHSIFRFAHHVKTQNQKSIFKVDLQSEKWKSKIENRFTSTYASRQWVDNRRVYWSQKIISFIKHSPGGLLIFTAQHLKMVQSLTLIQALKLLLSLVYWCYW